MLRIRLACMLALCCWRCGIAAGADWGVDVTAGANYDDNLSNGFASADRKGGGSVALDLGAGFGSWAPRRG